MGTWDEQLVRFDEGRSRLACSPKGFHVQEDQKAESAIGDASLGRNCAAPARMALSLCTRQHHRWRHRICYYAQLAHHEPC
jgi:hypothetical protein